MVQTSTAGASKISRIFGLWWQLVVLQTGTTQEIISLLLIPLVSTNYVANC